MLASGPTIVLIAFDLTFVPAPHKSAHLLIAFNFALMNTPLGSIPCAWTVLHTSAQPSVHCLYESLPCQEILVCNFGLSTGTQVIQRKAFLSPSEAGFTSFKVQPDTV